MGDDPPACTPRVCEYDGKVHQCGDCLDNDGDGGVDCGDMECFGPCDDSEAEDGSPLEDKDPCKQDCYFDGNGGQGGGDCQWNLEATRSSRAGRTASTARRSTPTIPTT